MVDGVVSGKRAASFEVFDVVQQWWIIHQLVRHDWEALESRASQLQASNHGPISPSSDFYLACCAALDRTDYQVTWPEQLRLYREWRKARPDSIIARTAFAKVALSCLWSVKRETEDDESLRHEVSEALDPELVPSSHPEFGCALLELDLLLRADDATFAKHRDAIPRNGQQEYFGAVLLGAARESSWFSPSADADNTWWKPIAPALRGLVSWRLNQYAFATSHWRRKNVSRQALPPRIEAESWAAAAKELALDNRLLNVAASSRLAVGEPDLAVDVFLKIGPNSTREQWRQADLFLEARSRGLAGVPAGPAPIDPTMDLTALDPIAELGSEIWLLQEQVRYLVDRGRIHELQAIATALHKSKRKALTGRSYLIGFLEGVHRGDSNSSEDRKQFDRTLQRWQQAYPKSELPKLGLAHAYFAQAHPEGPYRTFGSDFQQAMGVPPETIDSVLKSFPKDSPLISEARVLRVYVAKDMGAPIEPILAPLLKTDLIEPYERIAAYYCEVAPEKLDKAVERCVSATRGQLGEGAYALMAERIMRYQGAEAVDWARANRGFADLQKRFPSWIIPQRRLLLTVLCGQLKEAREQAAAIGLENLDPRVFGSLKEMGNLRAILEATQE